LIRDVVHVVRNANDDVELLMGFVIDVKLSRIRQDQGALGF
jgi:hypothetical protein